MGTYSLRSSSTSRTFWQPVAGFEMLNCTHEHHSPVNFNTYNLNKFDTPEPSPDAAIRALSRESAPDMHEVSRPVEFSSKDPDLMHIVCRQGTVPLPLDDIICIQLERCAPDVFSPHLPSPALRTLANRCHQQKMPLFRGQSTARAAFIDHLPLSLQLQLPPEPPSPDMSGPGREGLSTTAVFDSSTTRP